MTNFRPGNYSVKYMDHIDAIKGKCPQTWFTNLQWLNALIERGQHFVLPDNGQLIRIDDMPDNMPLLLRPPFPVTVIEFSVTLALEDFDKEDMVKASRRIIVAFDASEGFPPKCLQLTDGFETMEGVYLVSIVYSNIHQAWIPPTLLVFIPYDNVVEVGRPISPELQEKLSITNPENIRGMAMGLASLAPEAFESPYVNSREECDRIIGIMTADAQYELNVYQQVCMILGCSNVGTSIIPASKALNKSRNISKKRHLFDYHILSIPGHDNNEQGVHGSSGRTVRTHLRRGHIRRISSDRLVWVNAAVVRGRAPGMVHKAYNVRPGQ